MATQKTNQPDEFGDFQTPSQLAAAACKLLLDRGVLASSVVEPTCGEGSFLIAALDSFPGLEVGLGVEISESYSNTAITRVATHSQAQKVEVRCLSFFDVDWVSVLRELPEPILVVGNPPWVTNSALGALGSSNLPKKTNFQNFTGLEALTGKSNFDISEWMLIKLLELLNKRRATLAMLCKTAVARKVLSHAWKNDLSLGDAEIHRIDAVASFEAAVDACLLVCSLTPSVHGRDCRIFSHLGDAQPATTIGYHDGILLADVSAYKKWKHLGGIERYKWRSGVKHDCSKVMELRKDGKLFTNGLGDTVELEDSYVFPMLKSSDVSNGRGTAPSRWMLVTQRSVGDSTTYIRSVAPKTWGYLQTHGELLDRRGSSIYKKRPRFSMFGIGDYTFSDWKVCISGFYKKFQFMVVGPFEGQPVVLDDTSYFVACTTEEEARYIASLLNSEPAREFFSALVFWDAKRPITIELLRRLDLSVVARELGTEEMFLKFQNKGDKPELFSQASLF